jgi:hypothetical protein
MRSNGHSDRVVGRYEYIRIAGHALIVHRVSPKARPAAAAVLQWGSVDR